MCFNVYFVKSSNNYVCVAFHDPKTMNNNTFGLLIKNVADDKFSLKTSYSIPLQYELVNPKPTAMTVINRENEKEANFQVALNFQAAAKNILILLNLDLRNSQNPIVRNPNVIPLDNLDNIIITALCYPEKTNLILLGNAAGGIAVVDLLENKFVCQIPSPENRPGAITNIFRVSSNEHFIIFNKFPDISFASFYLTTKEIFVYPSFKQNAIPSFGSRTLLFLDDPNPLLSVINISPPSVESKSTPLFGVAAHLSLNTIQKITALQFNTDFIEIFISGIGWQKITHPATQNFGMHLSSNNVDFVTLTVILPTFKKKHYLLDVRNKAPTHPALSCPNVVAEIFRRVPRNQQHNLTNVCKMWQQLYYQTVPKNTFHAPLVGTEVARIQLNNQQFIPRITYFKNTIYIVNFEKVFDHRGQPRPKLDTITIKVSSIYLNNRNDPKRNWSIVFTSKISCLTCSLETVLHENWLLCFNDREFSLFNLEDLPNSPIPAIEDHGHFLLATPIFISGYLCVLSTTYSALNKLSLNFYCLETKKLLLNADFERPNDYCQSSIEVLPEPHGNGKEILVKFSQINPPFNSPFLFLYSLKKRSFVPCDYDPKIYKSHLITSCPICRQRVKLNKKQIHHRSFLIAKPPIYQCQCEKRSNDCVSIEDYITGKVLQIIETPKDISIIDFHTGYYNNEFGIFVHFVDQTKICNVVFYKCSCSRCNQPIPSEVLQEPPKKIQKLL
jgi:hypothetical protein